MSVKDYIAHAWNSISTLTDKPPVDFNMGMSTSQPSGKRISNIYSASSLSRVVYNRIATDAASMVTINHVKVDKDGLIVSTMDSYLQDCLTMEANIDQSSYQFFHDLIYSMCDEKAVAVLPVETTDKLNITGAFDINSLRVCKILQWYPQHVEIQAYDERDGILKTLKVPKRSVAILENPFSEILSSNNASLNRLKRKMSLLDSRDEEISSGTFNLLIQLPYSLKGTTKKLQAQERKAELEKQLQNNKYGVAYTGADEKVIQLNRPIADDLADQVKWLRSEFYNQLGLTENVFNGTASETEMNSYFARSIEPILKTITLEFRRKFLTKTARSQGQSIEYIRDVFALIPMTQVAQITDTLTRNAVASPNEMRKALGLKKALDAEADKLINRNIAPGSVGGALGTGTVGPMEGAPGGEAPAE